jgi:hypothetical protein
LQHSDNIVNQFITKVNEIGIWVNYEVKVGLLRGVPSDDWKVGVLHIKLLDYEELSYKILHDHNCLKLIREVRDMSTLSTLLGQIAASELLTFGNEQASLESITTNFKINFKDRQYMTSTYLMDNACYLLEKGSTPTQESKFREIEQALQTKLQRHTRPKEGLNEACKSILKINLGGAYSPHVLVYAPIFLKVHKIDVKKRRIIVYLYCHRFIKKTESQ